MLRKRLDKTPLLFVLLILLILLNTLKSPVLDAAKTPATLWNTTTAVTVNNAANNQTDVIVLPDGNNGSLLIWTDERTGVGTKQVYAQRLDSDGISQWANNGILVGTGKLNLAVSDGAGGAYIYFNSNELQRLTNTGTLWGGSTTLFSGFTGEMTTATSDAIKNEDGDFVVVRTNSSHVYVQKVNNSGVVQWGATGTQISSTTTNTRPKISTDGEGGAFVVMDNTSTGIVAQHVDNTGLKLFSNDGVSIRTGTVDHPGIMHDGVDGAFIVWKESTTGKIQRIGYAGNLQFTAAGVSLNGTWSNAADPYLVSDNAGGVVVNFNGGLTVNRRDSSGAYLWQATALLAVQANPGYKIAVTGDSVFLVGKRNTSGYICVYQYALSNGTVNQSCTTLDGSTQANTAIDPTILAYSNNDIVIAWSDSKISTSDRNIVAQRQGTGYQIVTSTLSVFSQYGKNIRTTATGTSAGGINSAQGKVWLGNATNPNAIVTVNMTQDRDWSSTTFSSSSNSFFAGNLATADGFVGFDTVYVRKFDTLYYCPNAVTANDVWPGCSNQITVTEVNDDVSIVNRSGTDYWQISNFSAGGVVSLGTYSASSFKIDSEPVAEEDAFFTFTVTPLNSLGELDTGYQGYINVHINAPSYFLDQNNIEYTNYDEDTGEVIFAWTEIHDPGEYTITVSDGTVSSSIPLTVVPRITNNALDYDFTITGDADGSCLGCDAKQVKIADFNNDGMDDIAVLSEVNNNEVSSINIIFGNATYSGNYSLGTSTTYNLRIDPINITSGFSGLNAADFDGDGKMDLVASAQYASNNSLSGSGSIYVFYGATLENYDTTTGNVVDTDSFYNVRFDGALANDQLNYWWEGGGVFIEDYNDDNAPDILVNNRETVGNSIYIIDNSIITSNGNTLGNSKHLANTSNYTIKYHTDDGDLGYYNGFFKNVSVGDANGDGNSDLVLGSESGGDEGSGAIYFIDSTLLLDLAGATGNDKSLDVSTNYTVKYMGVDLISAMSINHIADVNRDGLGDLLMASAYGDASENGGLFQGDEGMVFVVFSTLLDDYTTTGNSELFNDTTAYNVRVIGGAEDVIDLTYNGIQDWDGDGFKDLSVNSVYGYHHWLYKTGYVAIIYADTLQALGNSTGNDYFVGQYSNDFDLKITSDVYYHQPKMSGEHTDIDGDGLLDMFYIGHGDELYPDSTGQGAAYIISGAKIQSWGKTGQTILLTNPENFERRYEGTTIMDNLGGWNGGMYSGDFNGDSIKDVFITSGYVGAQQAEALYVDLGEAPPVPPSSITIDSPFIKVETGTSISITVVIRDINGDPLTGYTGTISFGSSDSGATLPPDYTFTGGDNGEHTFTDIDFSTPGNHTVTVTDEDTGTVVGEFEIEVVDTAGLSLGDPANYDLRIDGGEEDFCLACWDAVLAAGDINEDGIDDVVLHGFENGGNDDIIYVVFGGDNSLDQQILVNNNLEYNIRIEPDLVTEGYMGGITIQDVNNDGNTDLLIGSSSSQNNGVGTGSLYVLTSDFLSQFNLLSKGNVLSLANTSDFSLRIDGNEGDSITGVDGWPIVADYNNDSEEDLIIGSYNYSAGAVYLIDSSIITTNLTGTGNILDLENTSDYSIKYTNITDLGNATALRNKIIVEDLNGDNVNDLVLSSQSDNTNKGANYFVDSSLFVGITGTGNNIDISNSNNYTASIINSGINSYEYLSTAFAADVNQDNIADLILSTDYGTQDAGVFVLFSTLLDDFNSTGNSIDLNNSSSYNAKILTPVYNMRISPQGFADWDNNGFGDLMVTSVEGNTEGGTEGSIYYFKSGIFAAFGTSTGNNLDIADSNDYSARIDGANDGDGLNNLGLYVPSDLTGDSLPDLVLSADGTDYEGDLSGSVYVISNQITQGFGSTPGETVSLTNPSNFTARYDGHEENIGLTDWGLILTGDFNNGGIDDLIIGNYNASYNYPSEGSVWIIYSDTTPTNYYILGLTPPLNAVLQSDVNVNVASTPQSGEQNIRLRKNNIPLADTVVNFDSNKSWASVLADTDILNKKAIVTNLHSAPGANGTFSIYIPKGVADNRVYICPNPSLLSDVTVSCSGGSAKQAGDSGVSVVTIDSQEYWKIDNQNASVGGISYTYTAPVDPDPEPDPDGEEQGGNGGTENNTGNGGGNNNNGESNPGITNPADTTDTDNDGLTDTEEKDLGTNPNDPDTDNDNLTDGFEVDNSTPSDPLDPKDMDSDGNGVNDGSEDFDNDGLTNQQEQDLGTDPNNPDTNNNGIPDGQEDFDSDGLTNEFESNNPGSGNTTLDPNKQDSNGNGVPDSQEDFDNDGLTNLEEQENNTNPYNPDTDGDGILDGEEVDGCIYVTNTTTCSNITFPPTDPTDENSAPVLATDDSVLTPVSEEENTNIISIIVDAISSSIQNLVTTTVTSLQLAARNGTLPIALATSSGTALALSAVVHPGAIPYAFIWLRKRKKYSPYGVIYDETTNKPLAFVTIRVNNLNGEFVTQTVSDINGKYSLTVAPGKYVLNAGINNYVKLAKEIEAKSESITSDIRMKPIGYEVNLLSRTKAFIKRHLNRINGIIFYVGLAFAIFATVVAFNILNLIVLILFVVQIYGYITVRRGRAGKIYSRLSSTPLKGAFIRVFEESSGRQVAVAITDDEGKYNLLLKKGNYFIKVESLHYELANTEYKDALGVSFIKVEMKKDDRLELSIPLERKSIINSPTADNKFGFMG